MRSVGLAAATRGASAGAARSRSPCEGFLDARPSQCAHPLWRGADEHTRLVVVRRDHPGSCSSAVRPFVAVRREARDVAVEHGTGRPSLPYDGRADLTCDGRPDSIGADRDRGGKLGDRSGPALDPHAAHPATFVAQQRSHRRQVPNVNSRLRCRVNQDPVEDVTARGVQGVDSGTRADRHLRRLSVGVAEERAPDRGCARGDDVVQQPPTGQLQHAGAHQSVGRQRVAAVRRPVDQRHPSACSSEEHRGRGTGHPAPDNHHVIGGAHAAGSSLSPSGATAVEPVNRCRTTARAS